MSKSIHDEVLEELREIAIIGTNHLKKRIRTTKKIKALKEYDKDEIKKIRLNFDLSQKTFAELLGVSKKTVEAWELGTNRPSGSSSRLIELLEQDKDILKLAII